MSVIQTILHPTDFSDAARAAFRRALQIADTHDAVLHLLNVAPNLGEDPVRYAYDMEAGDESIVKKMRDASDAKMRELIEAVGAQDQEIRRVHSRGVAPGPVILEYAEDQEVDLVVMGTHGRRGVKRLVLGSVTEEVTRQAPCDVLTVRGEEEENGTPPVVHKLLVPVDFSVFSRPLLQSAKVIAASFGAQIDLIHVIEPLPFPAPLMGAMTLNDLVSDPGARTAEHLDELIRSTGGPHVPIELHTEEGNAAQTILDTAEALSSNMIVIASHGRSGLEGLLLGSVTARVIRKSHCPVWIARAEPEQIGADS